MDKYSDIDTDGDAEHVLRNKYGISAPLSSNALAAFSANPLYAEDLWLARNHPAFVTALLENPPEDVGGTSLPGATGEQSNAEPEQGWFHRIAPSIANHDIYHQRLAICAECPNKIDATTILQRLSAKLAPPEQRAVCQLCGCPVANKAKFAAADCPDKDPQNPLVSRWEAVLGAKTIAIGP